MKSIDKENLLHKLNFENRYHLNSMCEKVLLSASEDFICNFNLFNNCLVSNKLLHQINQYDYNGSPTPQVASSIKIIKIFSLLSIYKQTYFHSEESDLNMNIDINLLTHNIYKLLNNEQDIILSNPNNSIKSDTVELDILCSIIFNKYLPQELYQYDKIKNIIDSNQSSNTNNYAYEAFQKNFKVLIKFFLLSDCFNNIYSQLESKDKVQTSDIEIVIPKILKNLNEQSLFYIILKKFSELINANQSHLTKMDFYIILIKAAIL